MSDKARNVLGGSIAVILVGILCFNYFQTVAMPPEDEPGGSISLSRAGLAAISASNSDPVALKTATQLLDEAVRIDPKDPVALFGLGWALHLQQNKPLALERYNSAISELNELTKFSLLNRSLIREEQGDLQGALDDITSALGLAPELPGGRERQLSLRKRIVEAGR
jgi:tetratricopeptide (TPR) repeat protein